MGAGSLVVVGTGFGGYSQITFETGSIVEAAEKVLFLTENPLTSEWIRKANPTAESLAPFYVGRPDRVQTYLDMADYIMSFVRRRMEVCAIFYGHPGVFVSPSHEAIVRARAEGFTARMLPGISAEDCLFADLGVDPGRCGCQSFEATDFLIRQRRIDTTVPLILWQIGSIGHITASVPDNRHLPILLQTLKSLYGAMHEVVLYEATPCPLCDPIMEIVPLEHLAEVVITPMSTLYLPPTDEPPVDHEMARRLGLPDDYRTSGRRELYRGSAFPSYPGPKSRLRSIF